MIQGASPGGFGFSEDDGKRIAEGENIRRESRTIRQRVEDNAFPPFIVARELRAA
jgi:hypothetical protein